MVQIIVNGNNITQLGMPIEGEIQSLMVNIIGNFVTQIPKQQSKQVADWIYNIAMRTEMVWYNGALIEKDSIKKWRE